MRNALYVLLSFACLVATLCMPENAFGQDLSSLSVSPNPVAGTASAVGTVKLTKAAGSAGLTITLQSSDTAAATVPASVKVPAGATSETFSVVTYAVKTTTKATITGTDPSKKTATDSLTVDEATIRVSSVSLSPTAILPAHVSTGTVTLTADAPTGGLVVNVSSASAIATTPASITVPAGTKTATFSITAATVAATTTTAITAVDKNGYSASANLTVDLPTVRLTAITFSPATINAGASSTGTVTLSAASPSGGTVIDLSTKQTFVTIPATVTVAAGAKTATFTAKTTTTGAQTSASVSGHDSYGYTATGTLTVNLPAVHLTTLSVTPTTITAVNSGTGAVTLSGNAPTGGLVVNLSTVQTFITVPNSVTVKAGSSSATFTVQTNPSLTAGAATITGEDPNGFSAAGNFTVDVPAVRLSGLTLSQPSVVSPGSVSGTVTLTAAAPTGGFVIKLQSTESYVAAPATVTVMAGAKTASFTATANAVTKAGEATLSGVDVNGYNQTVGLIVVPNANGQTVQCTDFHAFVPLNLTVAAGSTVTWTNPGTMAHTVTGDVTSQGMGSLSISPGQTVSFKVPSTAKSGTVYYYHCVYHGSAGNGTSLGSGMAAAITVK